MARRPSSFILAEAKETASTSSILDVETEETIMDVLKLSVGLLETDVELESE